LDETQKIYEPIGFATILGFENDYIKPNIILLFGKLVGGHVTVGAKSYKTYISLVFVVPGNIELEKLQGPSQAEQLLFVLTEPMIIGSRFIPSVSCDSCVIKNLDGTENWTFTP